MKTSRRSIFSLFAGAAAMGTAAAVTEAKAETPVRRFVNGKLICRCAKPEWEAVAEAQIFYVPTNAGSHCHSVTGYGSHTHSFAYAAPAWHTVSVNHCIYCGGVGHKESAA